MITWGLLPKNNVRHQWIGPLVNPSTYTQITIAIIQRPSSGEGSAPHIKGLNPSTRLTLDNPLY